MKKDPEPGGRAGNKTLIKQKKWFVIGCAEVALGMPSHFLKSPCILFLGAMDMESGQFEIFVVVVFCPLDSVQTKTCLGEELPSLCRVTA